jgi:hypothetical protein
MKNIFYTILVSSSFLFTSCDTNDDGFYHNVFVEANNLVTIQTQSSYSVGDYLFITADFSRYLPDFGHTSALLDIYQSTGGATQYAFSYVIEKKINATDWKVVSVNDNQLLVNQGLAVSSEYVYGICLYNPTDQSFEYNVGFPLLSAGNYRLSFGYNSNSTTKVELRSLSQPKNLIMNINSTASGLDNNGFYNFVVN